MACHRIWGPCALVDMVIGSRRASAVALQSLHPLLLLWPQLLSCWSCHHPVLEPLPVPALSPMLELELLPQHKACGGSGGSGSSMGNITGPGAVPCAPCWSRYVPLVRTGGDAATCPGMDLAQKEPHRLDPAWGTR